MKNAPAVSAPLGIARVSRIADFFELAKPRLNALVIATSAAGYYLGAAEIVDWWQMLIAGTGTAAVAAGAACLNQLSERETDALMLRTRMRPLPDGRITTGEARVFGVVLVCLGLLMLGLRTNLVATALAAATLVIYLAFYTPLKRRSPLATLVGAVPGALPPLIGWAASRGAITLGGATLFAIVFLWQIPHFMAIAWLYRDDYRKAGFPVLPVIEPDGRRTGSQAVLYAAVLVPVTLVPALIGVSGAVYLTAAALLGTAFLGLAIQFARARTDATARTLFFASIVYLPLIWAAMIADKL